MRVDSKAESQYSGGVPDSLFPDKAKLFTTQRGLLETLEPAVGLSRKVSVSFNQSARLRLTEHYSGRPDLRFGLSFKEPTHAN